MHEGCRKTFGKLKNTLLEPQTSVFLRFPKVEQHPKCMDQHRGKTSAHAPNYENMAGNLNINSKTKTCLLIAQKLVKQTRKYSKWVD